MRYRLDFCDVVACDIPEEKKELYERSGWNVVGDFKNDCVVICTENPDAPEIYTDCELLVKPLKNIMLKYRIYVAALCVMLLTALVHCGLPDSVGVIRFLCIHHNTVSCCGARSYRVACCRDHIRRSTADQTESNSKTH